MPTPKTRPRIAQKSPSTVQTRADGREVRRLTVYLPNSLARRLMGYCGANDCDVSGVLTRLTERFLVEKR